MKLSYWVHWDKALRTIVSKGINGHNNAGRKICRIWGSGLGLLNRLEVMCLLFQASKSTLGRIPRVLSLVFVPLINEKHSRLCCPALRVSEQEQIVCWEGKVINRTTVQYKIKCPPPRYAETLTVSVICCYHTEFCCCPVTSHFQVHGLIVAVTRKSHFLIYFNGS